MNQDGTPASDLLVSCAPKWSEHALEHIRSGQTNIETHNTSDLQHSKLLPILSVTELNSTFETIAVLLQCHCQAKFI